MQIDVMALSRAIAATGRSVADVSQEAHVSQLTVGNWLKGEGSRPRLDTLGRLAKALDVDIYDIAKED